MKFRSFLIAAVGILGCAAVGCSDGAFVYEGGPSDHEDSNPGDDTETGEKDCSKGERTCLEKDVAGICEEDEDGQTGWTSKPCDAGSVCVHGRCRAEDEPGDKGCEDQCTEMGAFECVDDTAYKKCSNFNDDICLEWSKPQKCDKGKVCRGGNCVTPDEECTHECEPDARECKDNGFRTCTAGADGCRVWSEVTACANGCQDGACIPDAACDHKCDAGAAECVGGGLKKCTTDADGCRIWSEVEACPYGCADGRCNDKPACDHKCSAGARECSGNGYRTCTTDAADCRVWSSVTACDYGCEDGKCKDKLIVAMAPTRYPGDRILSPVTPYVVKSMKDIRKKNGSRADDHFMKMGDSHMYKDSSFMYCFSNNSSKHNGYNLNGLPFEGVAANFQQSFDSYKRVSVITILGETATLPIRNAYANLTSELNTTNPRFAFFGYGTNDMGYFDYTKFKKGGNAGYFGALQWYYRNVLKSMRKLISNGVIPMLIGTGWRADKAKYYGTSTVAAAQDQPRHFVTTYNAVARGIAEYYQIPYYNMQLSHQNIPNNGLGGDGIHHKTSNNGCDFTAGGLNAGANMRNRYAIEMLDRAWRTVIKGENAPDTETVPFEGNGTHADPFIISSLPYTCMVDSGLGEHKFNKYSCSTANESGPEQVYKLKLSSTTKIRAFTVSDDGVDVDIHLLSSLSPSACLARGDKWVEATLNAGTYYFVADTFGGDSNKGIYLFGIHACDPDDTACGSRTTGE